MENWEKLSKYIINENTENAEEEVIELIERWEEASNEVVDQWEVKVIL